MDKKDPPWLAEKLLSWFMHDHHEAVLGDLEEAFHDHCAHYGRWQAQWLYWHQVFSSIPPFFLYTLAWNTLMIRNYLKIAVRTLLKHKSFSGINILGLAASMAVCLLIILFIRDQKSYDSFHEQADRVYRVVADAVDPDSNVIAVSATPAPLAGVLERDMPGVEAAVRLRPLQTLATHEGKTLPVQGFFADASFFEVFSFPLAAGHPGQVLAKPNTIVLSRKMAERFFGTQNPIGQILTFDQGGDFVVTGVLDPFPGKSHLKFEALASFSSLQNWEDEREVLADWHVFYRYYTYVLLEDQQAAATLAAGLPAIVKQQYPAREQAYYRFDLQALPDINLGEARNNEIGFILPGLVAYFLAGLALIIMLTACFNYVGMSVARSLSRAREVGIRKVVGAHRGQIMRQFVSEAVVVALLALVVACGLLFVLVPVFNSLWFVQMSQTQIALNWGGASLYVVLLVFSVVVGIVAGLYPAVYLSRFAPVHVLQGGAGSQSGGLRLRKVLVASQFAFSLVFMV
ncbi:MAG TPA: ABC transporter permease, partial [Rhodothermales bacterium]|nr:ABC transporter permease [Rhodothermales bacterium]